MPRKPVQSFTPLEDSTNASYDLAEASLASESSHKLPARRRSLQRTTSYQNLARFADSSESFSDEKDDICTAAPALSLQSETYRSVLDDDPLDQASVPTTAAPERLELSENNPYYQHPDTQPGSYNQWHATRLDPIIERNSPSSFRTSTPLPRVSASPARQPHVVQSQDSIRSIHPPHGPDPIPKQRTSDTPQHFRSLSLNDVDTSPKTIKCCPSLPSQHVPSSSSTTSQILDRIFPFPAMPLHPTYDPPHRVPTPPGIPSFGTREALALRLDPPRSETSSIFGRPRIPAESLNSGSPPLRKSNEQPQSPTQARSLPMDMFQRIMGLNRPVPAPPLTSSTDAERTAPIPAHVQALARAPDGTYVRGAFGSRMSGHGVGRRGLVGHPYQLAVAHNREASALEPVAEPAPARVSDARSSSIPIPPTETSLPVFRSVQRQRRAEHGLQMQRENYQGQNTQRATEDEGSWFRACVDCLCLGNARSWGCLDEVDGVMRDDERRSRREEIRQREVAMEGGSRRAAQSGDVYGRRPEMRYVQST